MPKLEYSKPFSIAPKLWHPESTPLQVACHHSWFHLLAPNQHRREQVVPTKPEQSRKHGYRNRDRPVQPKLVGDGPQAGFGAVVEERHAEDGADKGGRQT